MSVFISGMRYSYYEKLNTYIQNNIPEIDLITSPIDYPSRLRDQDLTQIDYIFITRDIRIACLYHYLYISKEFPFIDPLEAMQEYLNEQVDPDGNANMLLKDNTFNRKQIVKFEQLMTLSGFQQLANFLGVPVSSFSGIPEKYRKYNYWMTYEEKYEIGHLIDDSTLIQIVEEACAPYQNHIDLYNYTTTTPASGDLIW